MLNESANYLKKWGMNNALLTLCCPAPHSICVYMHIITNINKELKHCCDSIASRVALAAYRQPASPRHSPVQGRANRHVGHGDHNQQRSTHSHVRGVGELLVLTGDEVEGWGEVVVGGEPLGMAEEDRKVGVKGVVNL